MPYINSNNKLKPPIFISLIFKQDIWLIEQLDKLIKQMPKISRTAFTKQAIKEKIIRDTNKLKKQKHDIKN